MRKEKRKNQFQYEIEIIYYFFCQCVVLQQQFIISHMKPPGKWTQQEQMLLKILVEENGDENCKVVEKINSNYEQFGRQCRQRYVNYSKFEKLPNFSLIWTLEQQANLYSLYDEIGPKWTKIAEKIEGKSENSIKNKFYGNIRKILRKINIVGKQKFCYFHRPIKYEAISKVFDVSENRIKVPSRLEQESLKLKMIFLNFCKAATHDRPPCKEDFLSFIKLIHQFNKTARYYRQKKSEAKRNLISNEKERQIIQNMNNSATELQFENNGEKMEWKIQQESIQQNSEIGLSESAPQFNLEFAISKQILDFENLWPLEDSLDFDHLNDQLQQ